MPLGHLVGDHVDRELVGEDDLSMGHRLGLARGLGDDRWMFWGVQVSPLQYAR